MLFRESLNNIFECVHKNCWPLLAATVSQGYVSDAHSPSPKGGIEVILEVKNELGGTDGDPIVELSSHYTQALKKDSMKGHLGSFSFPVLGVVVID